jgi:enoyl-CoA hydratase/carnithine racemase
MLLISEADGILELRIAAPCPIQDADILAVEILEACRRASERPDQLTAVVLRGPSDDFFLAAPASAADYDAVGPYWSRATAALAAIPAPVVAVIQGQAIGPAWELALACDLRIAAGDAILGSPEVRWGRIPAAGGTQRLVRAGGPTLALKLLLLGQIITGAEAAQLGLIHTAPPPDQIEDAVSDLLGSLRAGAPVALAYAKETALAAGELRLADGLRLEADLAALLHTTADRAEGLAAFLQKRPATFIGN